MSTGSDGQYESCASILAYYSVTWFMLSLTLALSLWRTEDCSCEQVWLLFTQWGVWHMSGVSHVTVWALSFTPHQWSHETLDQYKDSTKIVMRWPTIIPVYTDDSVPPWSLILLNAESWLSGAPSTPPGCCWCVLTVRHMTELYSLPLVTHTQPPTNAALSLLQCKILLKLKVQPSFLAPILYFWSDWARLLIWMPWIPVLLAPLKR